MGPPLEGHGKGFTQDLQRFYTLILIRNQLQKGTYKSRWEQRIIKLKLILGIFVLRANRTRRNDELITIRKSLVYFVIIISKIDSGKSGLSILKAPFHFTIHGPMSVCQFGDLLERMKLCQVQKGSYSKFHKQFPINITCLQVFIFISYL